MTDAQSLRLHGLMLHKPERETLERLQAMSEQHGWMQAGLHELSLTPLETWQEEYTRLFVNTDPDRSAPPYESIYRRQPEDAVVVERLQALYRLSLIHI